MASACWRVATFSRRDLADDPHAEAGAGERLAPHDLLGGRPSSSPTLRTSSLNSARSGSTSSKSMSSGSPPTLWCDLIVAAWPPWPAAGLDHVGVERALHEEAGVLDAAGGVLEDADEQLADRLALVLGVDDALELARRSGRRPARG